MNRKLALIPFLASSVAWAGTDYYEVPVEDVEPIRSTVRVVEPQERCWFEDVRQRRHTAHSATTPLVGALIGGAIGNALGNKKRNKQIGAVVGAALGGSIANDIRRREDHAGHPGRTVRQEICETVDRSRTVERVTGYMVTYRYAGQTYRTRVAQRPGDTIRIRVRVTPA